MIKQFLKKSNVLNAFLISLLFSTSLYLEYFTYNFIYLNTLSSLLAIYLILNSSKQTLFFIGFFISILWFHWVSFSLIYYEMKYLMPFVILGFAFSYGLIFYFIGIINNIFFKTLIFFALSYFHPFNFNWLQTEVIFVNSIFSIEKESFALILIALFSLSILKKYYKILFIIPLFFALETKESLNIEHNLKIYMPEMNVEQNKKWTKEYSLEIIELNNSLITKAIKDNYDLIILPETAYPIVLNKEINLLNLLLKKSEEIDIIVGSINQKNNAYYNSSYHFSKGKLEIANKVVLVPFGESIPFPKFIRDFINDIFYDGAEDFLTAENPSNFIIKGTKFRSSICYEATTDKIFEDLNDIKFMITISNNAWFMPSIEAILQKQLLKYYAKKYDIKIYHSVNGSPNYIIKADYFSVKKELKKLSF